MIADRIAAFIGHPESAGFGPLALDAFAFQYEHLASYRALCDRHGLEPSRVTDWRRVPSVPALAFRSLALHAAEPRLIFHGAASSAAGRSTHHHPFPDLYRAAVDASLPPACISPLQQPPVLSLVPSRQQAPHSSLAFMMEEVVRVHGAEDSLQALGDRGLDGRAARSFLAARQRDRRPTLIVADAATIEQLLAILDRLELRFRLPAGSRFLETEADGSGVGEGHHEQLVARLAKRLALPAEAVVRQYGPFELTSCCYTASRPAAERGVFLPPPWMRVRILAPETLQEQPPGEPGLVTAFDLANVGSAVHLVTEDLGTAEGDGFRLVGRAAVADLRQCVRIVEEMMC